MPIPTRASCPGHGAVTSGGPGACGKLALDMRRTLPLLLSLLLLVCAQSAGLLHGIGHAAARVSALPALDAPLPGAGAQSLAAVPAGPHTQDSRCDKCFQFAHFTGNAGP